MAAERSTTGSRDAGGREPRVALVTGGAGFIGTHLIRKILDRWPGVQVISVDNYFTGSPSNHVDSERVRYFDAATMGLLDFWQAESLPSPDVVFHLGEYSRIVQSFGDFDTVWEFNVRGTKEVVSFCHRHGARLVYAGSSSKFASEDAEHLSPYAWTKAKNIEYIANFADWFELDYVVTYFHNVYGPGQIETGPYATVIGIFERQHADGRPLTVVEPGTQTRDFTHVEDIVEGILVCYEHGAGDGYELGTSQEWQIIDVARMFSDDIEMVPARTGERARGKARPERAMELGWRPRHTLPEYVERVRERTARAGARADS